MGKNSAYILTIDVGTGSGRCIIFDLEGNEIASSQQEWLPKTNPRYPGSQDFDTREAWQLLCKTINDALGQAKIKNDDIIAVTSTSMREGMVLYNRDKEVIWACPNVDARATAEVVEMVKRDLAKPIYNIAGDWLSIISPPRLWWIRNNMPAVYEKIVHINMLSDWVLFKLSGEIVTDPSIGSSSGIFDLSKRAWSEKVIELAESIRRSMNVELLSAKSLQKLLMKPALKRAPRSLPVGPIPN